MRLRASFLSVAFLLGALPVALHAPAACASEAPHAALVVDTGESDLALCVKLPDESVTGIELIRLASEQHGLQYSLGFGGEAVCQLNGVGPDGDDCFADHPDFWGYWRGDGSGGWTWSSTGAGTTTVESGDVEGWSWGSGQDGSSHQQPPATAFVAVCGAPAEDEGEDKTDRDRSSMTGGDDGGDADESVRDPGQATAERSQPGDSSGGGDPETAAPGDRTARERSTDAPRGDLDPSPVEPTPEPQPHVALVAGSDDPEEPGPPVVGLVGLGLAIGLGITAATLTASRRRRKG